MARPRIALVLFSVTLLTASQACRGRISDDVMHAAIQSALQRPSTSTERAIPPLVKQWYVAHGMQATWQGRSADAVLGALADTATHGLDPERYGLSALKTVAAARDDKSRDESQRAQAVAALDVALTTALLTAGHDVSIGRTRPESLDREWKIQRTPPDLVATLNTAMTGKGVGRWLDAVAPSNPAYGRLRRWLANAQARGPESAGHADVIRANLERVRWLPDTFGDRYVLVNIPEFMLRVHEGDRIPIEMPVVVGKDDGHETPVLGGMLQSVVFNPYWNIPESIALAETVPAIEKDSKYLERHDMEVVRISAKGVKTVASDDVDWGDADALKDLRIRQRPGDDNALGKIKFPFSNNQAIYLHDTPATALFAKERRAFSHGCVRVSDPDRLVAYVLSGNAEWTAERIAAETASTKEQHVRLANEIPVYLIYLTVVAGPDGQPRYIDDVYGYDGTWLKQTTRRE